MTAQMCVVEGCNQEYDVTCSLSFYNVNTTSDSDSLRQEWIEGAMQEESECLWRNVSVRLCGFHFESDAQGLWIETPVLPELLTVHAQPDLTRSEDLIRLEHNYSSGAVKREPGECTAESSAPARLNVRQLVDTVGYLSLKGMQRKQLWVVGVDRGAGEASVSQVEHVVSKVADSPKQIIEIIPPQQNHTVTLDSTPIYSEVLEIMEETTIPDNFIYEIAEEQEVCAEEVKEIPYVRPNREWTVNIVPEQARAKYAFIKNCTTGRKKKHFAEVEPAELAPPTHYEDLYILPDADPSVGVEVTTTYEPEYAADGYQHLVLDARRHAWPEREEPRRRKRKSAARERDREYAHAHDDADEAKRGTSRVRRKNKRYLGYDFVT